MLRCPGQSSSPIIARKVAMSGAECSAVAAVHHASSRWSFTREAEPSSVGLNGCSSGLVGGFSIHAALGRLPVPILEVARPRQGAGFEPFFCGPLRLDDYGKVTN